MLSTDGRAGQVYQWKDATGIMHFTDNPAAVPLEYRNKGREMALPATISTPTSIQVKPGLKIWNDKCQECHDYNRDGTKQGIVGLFSFIINPVTKFPFANKVILNSLTKAAKNGAREGMPPIDISEEELKILTKFLIEELYNT